VVTDVQRRDRNELEPGRASTSGIPLTGAFAQTRQSWARRIDAIEDLPVPYRQPLRLELDGAPLPYAVLCPAFPRHAQPTLETLVVAIGDRLHFFARHGVSIAATSFGLPEVHAVDVGDVLLDSWLTVRGRTADLSSQSATVRFNAVGMELMLPFVDLVRPPVRGATATAGNHEPTMLRSLSWQSLKFYNLARSVLREGERVVDVVFQPAIRGRRRGPALPFLRREIASAHLVLLTESELIIASDIEGKRRRSDRYGHVRTHLPLRHVVDALVVARDDGLHAVRIGLSSGDAIEVVFEQATDVDGLVSSLRPGVA
jgi:hypothetical protein